MKIVFLVLLMLSSSCFALEVVMDERGYWMIKINPKYPYIVKPENLGVNQITSITVRDNPCEALQEASGEIYHQFEAHTDTGVILFEIANSTGEIYVTLQHFHNQLLRSLGTSN